MAPLPVFVITCCLTALIFTGAVSGIQKESYGCFGSAGECLDHNLTCSSTSRVAIEEALYGHKMWVNCTTGVVDCNDACCSYDMNRDCFNVFLAKDIAATYRNCSEHACHFRTPRLVKPCSRFGVSHQFISSYSVVKYECVEEEQIVPFCGAVATKYGFSVSIVYDPRSQYKLESQWCTCSVTNPGSSEVTIEGLDFRLTSTSGCPFFIIREGTTYNTTHCNSPFPWPNLGLGSTNSVNFALHLAGKPEFAWVRVTAATYMQVTCQLDGEQHTTSTPVPTTVTTTTSTTTTTTQYPTAPPVTTPAPPTNQPPATTPVPPTNKPPATTPAPPTDKPPATTTTQSTTSTTTPTGTNNGTGRPRTSPPITGAPSSGGLIDPVILYGAIGGAIGGIALLLILVFCICLCCCRDGSSTEAKESKPEDIAPVMNPGYSSPVYDNAKAANGEAVMTPPDPGYSTLAGVNPQYDNAAKLEDKLSPTVRFEDEVEPVVGDIEAAEARMANAEPVIEAELENPEFGNVQEASMEFDELPPPPEPVEDFTPGVPVDEETGNELLNDAVNEVPAAKPDLFRL